MAREEGIPLLDLQERTVALYEALGETEAAKLFNDGGADRTHEVLECQVRPQLRAHVPGLRPGHVAEA